MYSYIKNLVNLLVISNFIAIFAPVLLLDNTSRQHKIIQIERNLYVVQGALIG